MTATISTRYAPQPGPWRSMMAARAAKVALIGLLLTFPLLFATPLPAQNKPSFKVGEWVTSFSYSDSGRLAYATRRLFSQNKVRLQRDDIWVAEVGGKKRRIIEGEKFVRGIDAFSYSVRALRWSPDGRRLAIELATNEIAGGEVEPQQGVMTLLLEDTGREIAVPGGTAASVVSTGDGDSEEGVGGGAGSSAGGSTEGSTIVGAVNPAWLADGNTVVYLTADAEPSTLFTMNRVSANPARSQAAGPEPIFEGSFFVAVVWDSKRSSAVAIQTDEDGAAPLRLVALDLVNQTVRELAALPNYSGGLALSRSGKKVAYWVNNEQLEAREVDPPGRVSRVRVATGTLVWSNDETRVLVKRGISRRSTDLVWVPVPPMAAEVPGKPPVVAEVTPRAILHGLTYRMVDIPPNGNSVAVIEPGAQNLLVFPLQ